MLKTLSIYNLVLVEEAHLEFNVGLTVITGETGAGKTALIEAMRLIMGERADASKVRKGAEKAHIRASFEGEIHPNVREIFEVSGVLFPEDEPLIISREISSEGKSRAFVSGGVVPLSLLGKISPYLIDFVGQHAQILLKNQDQQRHLLDQFGGIDPTAFQTCYHNEKSKAAYLVGLKKDKTEANFTLIKSQLEQLESLRYIEGEEDALFQEFSLLNNSEDITAHCSEVLELSDRALTICHQIEKLLEKLPLKDGREMVKEAHLQLSELENLTQSLAAKSDRDPSRLTFLEDRLSAIDKAKKLFGKNLIETQAALNQRAEELNQIDEAIKEAEKKLLEAERNTNRAANELTSKRKEAATVFAARLSLGLQELNIEAAEVQIAVDAASRSSSGDDQVVFLLRANKGEKMALVKESSSGGEISRLLFCIKTILADKIGKASLVFDEIDAGVGGNTASLMGAKLASLGHGHQVLCVTHFPQVAKYGNHHIRVAKFERDGRTLCNIEKLDDREREAEYLRMLGGKQKLSYSNLTKE